MGEIIAELLLLWEDLKFWKKKKARRKFEEENNLPKKLMIRTSTLVLLIVVGFIIVARILIGIFYFTDNYRPSSETGCDALYNAIYVKFRKENVSIFVFNTKHVDKDNRKRVSYTISCFWCHTRKINTKEQDIHDASKAGIGVVL